MFDGCRLAESGFDAAGGTFFEQQRDNLPGRSVAEKLAEGFLVPGDPVTVDQGDEVGRREPAKSGFGEMGIGRKEIRGGGAHIGKIAPPAAGNQDLPARLGTMVDEEDAPSTLPGNGRAKHPGGASAHNDRVK
jgi:hypothetical protein